MNFPKLYYAAMKKRATAILTPEAEQAAVAPPDPTMGGGAPMGAPMGAPGGMPMDQAMAGGGLPTPAADAQMAPAPGGAPMPAGAGAAMPSGGGQGVPPEIMQDQGFIQWMMQQGIQLDPNSGTFVDTQSGQPLPPELVMQAYQAYMQQAQGGAAGGQPMPPEAAGAPAPAGAPIPGGQGGIPPEIANDQMFMEFMQTQLGLQLDPNSGTFVNPQTGEMMPADQAMQIYQTFQQQVQQTQAQGGTPGGAPADTSAMGAVVSPADAGGGAASMAMPPEISNQFQSLIDASLDNFSSKLDKKLETLLDKIDTLKMTLEALRDTDDMRSKSDKDESKQLQDEIAADLNPTVKTAGALKPLTLDAPVVPPAKTSTPKPLNMFDILMRK